MEAPSPNDITLRAYEMRSAQYIQNTPRGYGNGHGPLLRWIDYTLRLTPRSGAIFEIGSGHGRDARYISSRGYNIVCSDASKPFVDYLQQGHDKVKLFNAIKDSIPHQYHTIFANAVVPHFTADNTRHVLTKVYDALPTRGIFAFNAKQGQGDEWINEKNIIHRYIHYWRPQELAREVEDAGFKIVFFEDSIQGGDLPHHTWIHIVAQK